ncbi:hypothetical protein BpHYR1_015478 [Brachionus plicatilis]|uniref:Uncharacterized protein n=1 Tax=Brachionus plicatilis TaxID=10195 RepID=A0A3M7PJW7_BRAPC|nr:hypothetical protein BpHYR1_015478 [Brachionus plicatilis]
MVVTGNHFTVLGSSRRIDSCYANIIEKLMPVTSPLLHPRYLSFSYSVYFYNKTFVLGWVLIDTRNT